MLRLLPVLAALALAACGGAAGTSATGSTPTSPPASAPPSVDASAGQVVMIEESEFKLTPARISVKAGRVTFDLSDTGKASHDLHIAPAGTANELVAGGTATFTVTLAPGTYAIWCGVPGHRQAGMQGTVTAT